jgi:hypothetical protein
LSTAAFWNLLIFRDFDGEEGVDEGGVYTPLKAGTHNTWGRPLLIFVHSGRALHIHFFVRAVIHTARKTREGATLLIEVVL